MSNNTLNPRERLFVKNLLRGMSKRRAATLAGYSAKTASQQASYLLKLPRVIEAIETAHKTEDVEVSLMRSRVLRELYETATADLSRAFDDQWQLKNLPELPAQIRRQIVFVRKWDTPEQGSGCSVKFSSKLEAQKAFLKLCPAPVQQASSLEDAAQEVEQGIDELISRLADEQLAQVSERLNGSD